LERSIADIHQHEEMAYTLDGMCCIIEQLYFVCEGDLFFY